MHKWRKWVIGPFKQKCIYEWFKQEVYPLHFKQNLNKLKDAKQKSIEASKAKNKFSNNIKIFNHANNPTATEQTPDSHSQEVAAVFEKQEKDKALDELLDNVQN